MLNKSPKKGNKPCPPFCFWSVCLHYRNKFNGSFICLFIKSPPYSYLLRHALNFFSLEFLKILHSSSKFFVGRGNFRCRPCHLNKWQHLYTVTLITDSLTNSGTLSDGTMSPNFAPKISHHKCRQQANISPIWRDTVET